MTIRVDSHHGRDVPPEDRPSAVGAFLGGRAVGLLDRDVRILLVATEGSQRDEVELGLTMEGFEVDLACDGPDALRSFSALRPDIVLLDLMLTGGIAGTEVCRRMRTTAAVPVVVVSALDAEDDVVLGLEAGAIDYLTEPYSLHELVARIRSVLRRTSPDDPSALAPMGEVAVKDHRTIEAGPVTMDLARREVTCRGRMVRLARREFDLLALLLSPPGQVRTREDLIDRLWSDLELADSRTLDTHVRRLRQKIERRPDRPEHLVTLRRVGFRFDPAGAA